MLSVDRVLIIFYTLLGDTENFVPLRRVHEKIYKHKNIIITLKQRKTKEGNLKCNNKQGMVLMSPYQPNQNVKL